jgi:hypothetical protein
MGKYITKYFGEIEIDETSDFEYINVMYDGKEINICFSDCNRYGDKLRGCLGVLDRYVEVNETGKKAILSNFPGNETVRYYFECHFDALEKEQLLEIFGAKTFKEFDVKKTVENLGYPDLLFSIKDDEISFSVDYRISEACPDEILCVRMDENINVINFSHES